jgi:arylformamidase
MIVYPGDREVVYRRSKTIEKDGYNWSEMSSGTHIGTHIDAPAHFVAGGKTMDEMPLDLMIGRVLVVATDAPMITKNVLAGMDIADWSAVFFKTGNQRLWQLPDFSREYVSLTPDAAEFLAGKGSKLVGIDYKSIECFETHDYPVHKILLGSGAYIIEGLYLNDVPAGRYDLFALPLKLRGGDGAPVRVVLAGIA